MTKVKTKNKWDETTPLQRKIGTILKTIGILVFLSVWTPAFYYAAMEIIKYFVK